MNNSTVVTTKQLLADLSVPYWTLHAAIRAGHIPAPATKLGTGYLWTPAEREAARRYFENRDAR